MLGPKDESDEALIARAGRGDRLAAAALIERHADRVYAVCRRMLTDEASAEDAAQETFLRLWTSSARWKPGGAKLTTWLYRVATNICIDRLRRGKREAPEEAAPEPLDETPGADAGLIDAEQADILRAAVDALPDRQRLAVVLCSYEELSNAEAAEVLEVSVEALESLLSRARRSLRQKLSPMREEFFEGEEGR